MTFFQAIDYRTIAQFVVSLNGILLFCFSIFFGSIAVYFIGFKSKISSLIKNLRKAIETIKQTSGPNEFAFLFDKLDKDLSKNEDIKHCWSEFKETLVMPPPITTNSVICNTEESVCFFNENTVIAN